MDSLANTRRLKCLTVADDFSRESIDITVDHGISGSYVVRVLEQPALFRGYPRAIRTDGGPEFASRALLGWAHEKGIEHILIEPGKPTWNPYIESFNGKFFEMSVSTSTGLKHWRRLEQKSRRGDETTTK
jgi:putative transposase